MIKKIISFFVLIFFFVTVSSQSVNFRVNGHCGSSSISFTSSVIGYSNPINYSWTFGDGSTGIVENPTHTYTSGPGLYVVTLIINNDIINAVTKNVYVLTLPDASFTVDSTSENVIRSSFSYGFNSDYFDLKHDTNSLGEETFKFISTYNNTEIEFPQNTYEFKWYFDDDSTSSQIDPMHAYQEAGDYNVSLEIKNMYGCIDTKSYADLNFGNLLHVYDSFLPEKIPNVFTPDGDGVNDIYFIKVDGVNSVYKFQVYAPTGILVYQSESRTVQWDGKNFAGDDVLPGSYFYVIEATEGNTGNKARGIIYLFRNN